MDQSENECSASKKDMGTKFFSQSHQMQLRSHFLEAIEELRLKRVTEVENEDKAKQLVNEKHILKNKNDELKEKITLMRDEQTDKMHNAKGKYETLCNDVKVEKNKLVVTLQTKEKEIKNLKDEIRAMQLSKYSLEKKVKDFERKQQIHTNSNEGHMAQAEKLEEVTKSLLKRFNHLAEQQDRLAKNVKELASLHDKLLYVNSHKDCEIQLLKTEISNLKSDLCECRMKFHGQKAGNEEQLQQEKRNNEILREQMKNLEDQVRITRNEKEEYLQDKEKGMQALKDCHKLLDNQVCISNKHNERAQDYTEKLESTKNQLDNLKQKYDEKTKELDIEMTMHKNQSDAWKEKEQTLQNEIELKSKDHESLLKAHAELDALNSNWSKKNNELTEKYQELKNYVDRPRTDVESQTGYLMETVYVQTETGVTTASVQTETSSLSCYTQTENVMVNQFCQTDENKLCSIKLQTDEVAQCHFQVQVDLEYAAIVPDHGKPSGNGVDIEYSPPLSSSQPTISQTSIHVDQDLEAQSSSQPLTDSMKVGPSAHSSIQPDGSGDQLELSPYSRFQATLKKLSSKRKTDETFQQDTHKKSKSGSLFAIGGDQHNQVDQEDIIPPTQATTQPVGILQNFSANAFKRYRASKRVTFSSQLEQKKEFTHPQSVPLDPMSLDEEEDDIALFSDEEDEEKFEIGTQVSRVEHILIKDRLKSKKT